MIVLVLLILKWAQPTPSSARFNFCDRSKLAVPGPKWPKIAQNHPKSHFRKILKKDSTAYHLHQFPSKFIWSKFIGVLTKLVFSIFEFLKFRDILTHFRPKNGKNPKKGPKLVKNGSKIVQNLKKSKIQNTSFVSTPMNFLHMNFEGNWWRW